MLPFACWQPSHAAISRYPALHRIRAACELPPAGVGEQRLRGEAALNGWVVNIRAVQHSAASTAEGISTTEELETWSRRGAVDAPVAMALRNQGMGLTRCDTGRKIRIKTRSFRKFAARIE
jgi:hypothetical protein